MKYILSPVRILTARLFCKPVIVFTVLFGFSTINCLGADEKKTSTKEQAAAFIDKIIRLDASSIWPGIKPDWFLKNVKTNIYNPVTVYPGEGTYFCAYSALTYLILQDDPLGYAKFVLALYKDGKAVYKETVFNPSATVKLEAGRLNYKGIMDIHPADQMWYLTLADHFKGYLNFFNRKYKPGDEDSFWASANYAKHNRMAKKLLYYHVEAKGFDLFRPRIKDMYQYLNEKLSGGNVILYINNRIVYKKNHVNIKLSVPTHFIVLEKITKVDDTITLIYWDNGAKTLLQLSPAFLKRIIYGITVLTRPENE